MWCRACAKEHEGAVNVKSTSNCEDCQVKVPNFGIPSEGDKRRWCDVCAKGHAGAVNLKTNMCAACGLEPASARTVFGMPVEDRVAYFLQGRVDSEVRKTWGGR
jgi:hypothetical protein